MDGIVSRLVASGGCSQLYRLLTVNLPDEFRPGHVDGTVDGPRLGGAISGEKSEEDHATNLIYIEIFKIGVDPLSEAAVVKTKVSSAGTREPSARRIDVD